ncbi:MAG: LAGLIDADG family homing endonuclease [archaeon]|jgi:hypothetical protein
MADEGFTQMQKLNPDYILGLVDGEGSFTVYIRNPDISRDVKRRVVVEPKFYVKLVERDKEILESLRQYFGCGTVYFQKDTRPNHQNCYRYEVYNRQDLINVIIPFFKKNKLRFATKSHDFKIFCEIMEQISEGKHLKEVGLRKLFKLKQLMH